MGAFPSTVLALSVGGSMMAALLYGLKLLLGHRLSSAVYYYLWLLVLLRFMLPLPGFMHMELDSAATTQTTSQLQTVPYSDWSPRAYNEPDSHKTYSQIEDTVPAADITAGEKETDIQSSAPRLSLPKPDTGELIFALWLLGTMLSLLYTIISYLIFARSVRREALSPESWEYECYRAVHPSRKPGLIKSLYVSTPMLMGLFSPCLVLPEREYNQEILRNIFLHELKHYSRADLVYKWFTVLVLSVHWFNPLAYLIRREINRACETSCDELLISRMDRDQRQSYGETLISLAARRPLPMGIVATSFAMEKRDLKERLTKIMKYKKTSTSFIAALLSLLLLAGCGAAVGPVNENPEAAPESIEVSASAVSDLSDELSIFKVSSVDELIGAIGSDRIIYLNSGVYDLSNAEGYTSDSGDNWHWKECYDGSELVISNVTNMYIIGLDGAEIVTRPRYANVLSFEGCSNIGLEDIVMGHTIEDGFCTGGVLNLDSCRIVTLKGCSLYGCGTVGIMATNCEGVYATGCEIYDCSIHGINAVSCKDVIIEASSLHSNRDAGFQSVFRAESCMGFAIVNCEVYDNEAQNLLRSAYSQQVSMLGCKVEKNTFINGIIHALGYSPVIEQCSIADTDKYLLYADLPAVDAEGNELTRDDLEAMVQSKASYEGMVESEPVELNESTNAEGMREVSVSTVDEFLAAIADNTVIKLEAELFDLSTASDYGTYGGDNYYWLDNFDGPGLIINGVENLSIVSENGCTIAAIPRYANVLSFINCQNLSLSGFTAGHTEEPGMCSGGVLDFQDCWGIDIENCHLFGCGILGITARSCSDLNVSDTEIYECSQGAISLSTVMDASFNNMDIHDCYSPEIYLYGCMNTTFEGEELKDACYYIDKGKAEEYIINP